MNLIFINYQIGNGIVNKQTFVNMNELEEKIKLLMAETQQLKKLLFELKSEKDINENWPKLTLSQLN